MNVPRQSKVLCICRKELVDAFRDRKSMLNVLFYTLIGPLVLLPILVFLAKPFSHSEEVIHLPTIGIARAPALVESLRAQNILPEETKLDLEAEVRSTAIEIGLVIENDYAAALAEGRPAPVRVVFDGSRASAMSSVRRVTFAVDTFGRQIGMQRLIVRGVAPSAISAVGLVQHDISTPQQQAAAILLGSVPIFILMAMIMGSGFAAVDVTAGEQERGSLEPLFANPVTAAEIIVGKLLAVAALGAVATVASVVGFGLVLDGAARFGLTTISFPISIGGLVVMLLGILPLCLAIAAVEMRLASGAKTVREANTVVMMLTLAPTLPGLTMVFGKLPAIFHRLPVVHEELLIAETFQGKALSIWRLLGGGALAFVLAGALVVLTVRSQLRSQAS